MFASISMAVRTKMPRGFKLDWRGDEIKSRLLKAARQGIDETMADCVTDAKRETPVRTGTLQGSVRFEPAEVRGNEAKGTWGSFDVSYAIYVEIGTRGRPGVNMLRDAADENYPKLDGNIRSRFGRS